MAGEAQNNPQQEVIAEEYMSSLADLTVNSKPLINMLTMLAEENVESAPVIVKVIEKHLSQVKPEMKLPVLYLVDSIVKNIGGAYSSLFTQNIVSSFCSVFEKVEESTRASMFKLRQTWSDVFPPKKLYALDVRVKSIDPAWPVTAPLPTSIHLNPAFLPKEERVGYKPNSTKKSGSSTKPTKPVAKPATPAVPASDLCETEMRESLLKKQKELLELQQKKLEIELLQTKARLQQQQIQLIQTVQQTPPDVVTGLPIPEEKLAPIPLLEEAPAISDAICVPEPMELAMTPPDLNIEDLITTQSPVDHRLSRSPEKKTEAKKDKKDRDRDKEPGRKKLRKDSDKESAAATTDPVRINKMKDSSRSRKGKEQPMGVVVSESEPGKDDEVVVIGGRSAPRNQPNLREAAKAMPRIPKISQRHPSAAGPSVPHSRDPRLMMLKSNQGGRNLTEHSGGGGGMGKLGSALEDDIQVVATFRNVRNHAGRPRNSHKRPPSPGIQAERRKMEAMKNKEGAVEPKKRRTNRFDDLFGNEDIDLRKVPAAPVVPAAPGVVIPPPLASRESPPRGGGWMPHNNKRGHAVARGRGGWPGRGGRGGRVVGGPREEDERELDGSGSPRNMDFILEQARDNHKIGVINDTEYSTIIRQVFQMSETKMIREVQRRESFSGPPAGPPGPPHPHPEQDFRYRDMPPGPYGPEVDRGWNDPRRGGYPFHPGGPGRMQRFDNMIPPGRGHLGPPGPINSAFEVRPDEDMKTIPIDNVPREIRFYGDKAIILMAAEDPRLLGFQPCVRRVLLDNMPVDCTVGNDYMDFHFDGQIHHIKIGAPTRELYIDGNWYECMFGGPPITVVIGGRPVQAVLEGPPPTVKIGTDRRLDLLAGRVTMIIDAHSVIPVYLDLKLQHFEMDGQVFTLQFKDALRTVVIDGHPHRVDFGGLPMGIHLDGRNHFVRFSSLPRGVEPGRVLQPLTQGEENALRKTEDEKSASQTPPLGQVNINELLSQLVATGLIMPRSTPETVKPAPVKEEVKKEEKMRVVNLGDSDCMKVRPTVAISMLYSGMQCGSCGLRFPADQTVRYSTHLDWHFRQNRREKGASKRPQSRKWYCSVSDWIQFEETEGSEEKRLNWFEAQAKEKSEKDGDRNGEESTPEESTSVAVGSAPEENKCFVCHEELDQFFHEESEEWHLKDAVRAEGITFHRLCYRDHLVNLETGAYSPSDAVDEYKSASDEEKSASEEEKSASDDDKAVSGTDDDKAEYDSAAETKEVEENEIVESEPMDMQEPPIPLFTEEPTQESEPVDDFSAEIPFIKTEIDKSELEAIIPDEPVLPAVKEEPANVEVPFEDEQIAEPVLSVETTPTTLSNSVKMEVLENDNLFDASSQNVGSELIESVAEFTSIMEEVKKVNCEDDEKVLLDDLDEVPDVQEPIAIDEALIKAEDGSEGFAKPPTPQIEEENESRDKIFNGETDSDIPDPLLSVVQTPAVNSSLDGNVEMSNKQPAAPAPAGIKIKINLFNKAPPPTTTTTTPVPAPTEPVAVAPSGPVPEIPENSSELLISPSDETALTNKPRMVGRKLTVLPPMSKGVETSGLCSIM